MKPELSAPHDIHSSCRVGLGWLEYSFILLPVARPCRIQLTRVLLGVNLMSVSDEVGATSRASIITMMMMLILNSNIFQT